MVFLRPIVMRDAETREPRLARPLRPDPRVPAGHAADAEHRAADQRDAGHPAAAGSSSDADRGAADVARHDAAGAAATAATPPPPPAPSVPAPTRRADPAPRRRPRRRRRHRQLRRAMGARHPLPYAYAKAHTLLLEDDGERLVLWAPETVGLPALSRSAAPVRRRRASSASRRPRSRSASPRPTPAASRARPS